MPREERTACCRELRVEVPHWKVTRESTSAGLGEHDWVMWKTFLRYGGNNRSKLEELAGLGDGGAGVYLSSYLTSPQYLSY